MNLKGTLTDPVTSSPKTHGWHAIGLQPEMGKTRRHPQPGLFKGRAFQIQFFFFHKFGANSSVFKCHVDSPTLYYDPKLKKKG